MQHNVTEFPKFSSVVFTTHQYTLCDTLHAVLVLFLPHQCDLCL